MTSPYPEEPSERERSQEQAGWQGEAERSTEASGPAVRRRSGPCQEAPGPTVRRRPGPQEAPRPAVRRRPGSLSEVPRAR